MKKVGGYVFSVVGLALMVLGLGVFGEIDLFGLDSIYLSGAGVVLVIVGVVFAMMSSEGGSSRRKMKDRGENEIPIYEGVGKKRRIVGYRKD